MTTPDDTKFWEDRGIDPEVRDARPYERWTIDPYNIDPVKKEYADLSQGKRAFMTRIANQADGLLIHRHPPEGYAFIYAELRPDKPVTTTIRKHWHGYGEPPAALHPRLVYDADLMQAHRTKEHSAGLPEGEIGNTEEAHKHEHKAKYLFPPSGAYTVPWVHDHRGMQAGMLAGHIEKRHKGESKEQLAAAFTTRHWHTNKYKDKSQNFAARADIHPLAREKFAGVEVVYFALEGCLKADSILSVGEPVLSVPSVTLWLTPEIQDPEFRDKYLRGKTVVIVPDADWRKNGAVIMQARFLQTYLRHHGLEALVAAPPQKDFEESGLKGIDDFLGAGGKLDDLEVVEHYVPEDVIHNNLADLGGRVDSIIRDTEVLSALAAHAHEGKISVPYKTLARIVQLHGTPTIHPRRKTKYPVKGSKRYRSLDSERKRVTAAVHSLKSHGIVSIEGAGLLETTINPYSFLLEWVQRPTIVIAPEFRGEVSVQRLGDCTFRQDEITRII